MKRRHIRVGNLKKKNRKTSFAKEKLFSSGDFGSFKSNVCLDEFQIEFRRTRGSDNAKDAGLCTMCTYRKALDGIADRESDEELVIIYSSGFHPRSLCSTLLYNVKKKKEQAEMMMIVQFTL